MKVIYRLLCVALIILKLRNVFASAPYKLFDRHSLNDIYKIVQLNLDDFRKVQWGPEKNDGFELLEMEPIIDPVVASYLEVLLYPSTAYLKQTDSNVNSQQVHFSLSMPVTVLSASRYVYSILRRALSYYLSVRPEEFAVFKGRLKSIMLGGQPLFSVEAEVRVQKPTRYSYCNASSDEYTNSEGFLKITSEIPVSLNRVFPGRFQIIKVSLFRNEKGEKIKVFETPESFKYRDSSKAVQYTNAGLLNDMNLTIRAAPVKPLGGSGYSFISDIDDTIKVTEVLDKYKTLRNVFVNPMQPVQGMSALYRHFEAAYQKPSKAHLYPHFKYPTFHYVSNSPLQLYKQLEWFRRTNKFPEGSFHLRPLDFTKMSIFGKLKDMQHKTASTIEIIRNLPDRTFVLIGDDTEYDPEIYATVTRMPEFKGRIRCIWIRLVNGVNEKIEMYKNSTARFEEAMRDIPRRKWGVFLSPEALRNIDLGDKYAHCQPGIQN